MKININTKITSQDKIDLEEIVDNHRYETVAYIVDKDDFIMEVKKFRESLGLVKTIPYGEVKQWLRRKTSDKAINAEESLTFRQIVRLHIGAHRIRQEFNLGEHFQEIIKYVILAGKVTDNEFQDSAFCAIYPFEFEEPLEFTDSVVAIFLNPETSIREVENLMKNEVKKLFKEIGRKNRISKKTSPNIRDARKWYWLKKEMTYPK